MRKKTTRWIKIWSTDGKECRDFTDEAVVKATGYSLINVRRWADGAPIPEPARQLLAMTMLGCLPDKAWQCWRVSGGHLYNIQTGDDYEENNLDWASWVALQFADYRGQIRMLEARNVQLAQQLATIAKARTRCLPSWHQRQPPPPRQFGLFDFPQAQKSPA